MQNPYLFYYSQAIMISKRSAVGASY
jgi:hypothetical protein